MRKKRFNKIYRYKLGVKTRNCSLCWHCVPEDNECLIPQRLEKVKVKSNHVCDGFVQDSDSVRFKAQREDLEYRIEQILNKPKGSRLVRENFGVPIKDLLFAESK